MLSSGMWENNPHTSLLLTRRRDMNLKEAKKCRDRTSHLIDVVDLWVEPDNILFSLDYSKAIFDICNDIDVVVQVTGDTEFKTEFLLRRLYRGDVSDISLEEDEFRELLSLKRSVYRHTEARDLYIGKIIKKGVVNEQL
jgi:hypothetical protein